MELESCGTGEPWNRRAVELESRGIGEPWNWSAAVESKSGQVRPLKIWEVGLAGFHPLF